MDFTPASAASVAAFLVLVALVIAAFLAAVWHAARTQGVSVLPPTLRAGLGLSIWLALLSGFVASGLMPRLSGQGAPHFFGAVILVSMWAGLSPLGARLARVNPLRGEGFANGLRRAANAPCCESGRVRFGRCRARPLSPPTLTAI